MIGLIALDLVLGLLLAGVARMPLVLGFAGVDLDDPAADMAGLRVPRYLITNFEALRHLEPVGAV